MPDTLMLKRRFAPLFWAQFFSAFKDNFLKNELVFIILYKLAGSHGEALVTLAGGLFIAPFFLLSAQRDATKAAFQAHAKSRGAYKLMVPAEVMVVPVPTLGSGKLDFAGFTRLVRKRSPILAA